MARRRARWLWAAALPFLALSVAAAPKASSQGAYERARGDYFALKASRARQKYRHHWLRVIASFREVESRFPTGREAAAALYTTAELFADLARISGRDSDVDQALAAYAQVVARYPQSSLCDDATYERAQLYLRRFKDRPRAAREVQVLLGRWGKGDMAAKARALAALIGDVGTAAAAEPETDAVAGAIATGTLVGRRESAGPIPKVLELKAWNEPDYARVAIYLSGPAQAQMGSMPGPQGAGGELVVDIAKAERGDARAPDIAGVGLLAGLELGAHDPGTVRAVLATRVPATARLLVMENPYRVVIDAYRTAAQADVAAAVRGRHVVLDPGHGGKDGGTRGASASLEKNIVLALGQAVARRLEGRGVEVTLTRDRDLSMALEERTAIANRVAGDVFVSIHANANAQAGVHGVEVYYLDTTDDAYALRLAAVENQTNEEQVSDLQLILADLATKMNTERSLALAKALQAGVVAAARSQNPQIRDLGVKGSLFYVLVGTRMPAALLEVGFLSNKREGALLADSSYREALAGGIADAIVLHLSEASASGD
ncbi:MAG: N-acetylmuramoyl-L-alanine amidase [Deltaproteobacteria bacterium]|nr:N-acetylmuramoyl-L-alanine amidase [Deltaproteobacteria bacterium]